MNECAVFSISEKAYSSFYSGEKLQQPQQH